MPSRNLIKEYAEESYYHIYNRGVDKQVVFKQQEDFVVFLGLLKRYLGSELQKNSNRIDHPNYFNEVELLAFCLMPNHFHLFIYQADNKDAITRFMRSIITAYSMYFNKKYKRVGPLFQQRYKAVRITDEAQFEHISRYIHLNPAKYSDYEWSSYSYYLSKKKAEGEWLKPNKVMGLFKNPEAYKAFVEDYKDKHDELEDLKILLADG